MVHGDPLGWLLAQQPHQSSATYVQGQICDVHHAPGCWTVPRATFRSPGLALHRGPAHGRGYASTCAADVWSLWRTASKPGWGAGTDRGSLEVRLQEHQIHHE